MELVLALTVTSNINEFINLHKDDIESFYRGDDFLQVWFKLPTVVDMKKFSGFAHD